MDRDLLFGVIAVQLGQATPQQVMAAASAFALDRSRSVAELLVAHGALTEQHRAMLDGMVDAALKSHGGDVPRAIATIGGNEALYASFGGSLAAGEKSQVPRSGQEAGDSIDDPATVFPEQPGRYRIEPAAEIGRGGIGRVLIAFDQGLGREIAVKELLADSADSPISTPKNDGLSKTAAIAARFLREARVTGQLEHPNIVPVYEVGQRKSGALYYTMKLVRGRTLAQALSACRGLKERLKLLHHFVDLCNAVAYAHARGVIHRDIKTENVMLGEFGETVVLDWGLAKVKGKQDLRGRELERELRLLHDAATGQTIDGSAIGTPAYMSPEQAEGRVEDIDERSDIWSLGAVLYEVLTGNPPFQGCSPYEIIGKVLTHEVRPPRALDEAIPAELSAVAMKALTRDRAGRYAKAGELAEDVGAYMSGGRIGAYEYGSLELLRRFVARNKAVSGLVLLVVVLVGAGAVALYGLFQRAEVQRDHAAQEMVKAQRNEEQAELNLASALQEKAERLFDDRRVLSSRIYAAAALVQHPCYRLGLRSVDACNARFRGGAFLRTRALSTLFQTQFEILARPERVHRGESRYTWLDSSTNGRLLTCDSRHRVELWDTKTMVRLVTLRSQVTGPGKPIAIAPDGGVVATCDRAGPVALWDEKGTRQGTLSRPPSAAIYNLEFSPRRNVLAVVGSRGTELWDTTTRTLVRTVRQAGLDAFSPDGNTFTSSRKGTVELWDVNGGRLSRTFGPVNVAYRVGFSPDGKRLAVVGQEDRSVSVFDVESGTLVHTIPGLKAFVTSARFSPDGRFLTTTAEDRAVRIYDTRTFAQVDVLEGHRASLRDERFLPDGRLVTAGDDATWRTWRLETGRPLMTLEGHTARIWALSFSADGRRLASASTDGTIRLWDTGNGHEVGRFSRDGEGFVSARFSPDGKTLVSSVAMTKQPPIVAWDVATGKQARSFGEPGDAFCLRISPDGTRLSTTHRTARKVSVWDSGTGAHRFDVKREPMWMGLTAFSADSGLLAVGSEDKSIELWDVKTGTLRVTLTGQPDAPMTFAFVKGSSRLLAGGRQGSLLLWDVEGRRILRRFSGHSYFVNTISVVPGERLFVTSSDDATVRIWSVDASEPLLVLRMAGESYESLVTPDGKQFAAIDGTTIVLYPLDLSLLALDPKELLARAEQEAGMRLEGASLVPQEH